MGRIGGLFTAVVCLANVVLWTGAMAPSVVAARADKIVPRTLPVAACNGQVQGVAYKYKGPWSTKARLTAADAANLVSFNGGLLAPREWKCDLSGGSSGVTLVAYNPRSGFFASDGSYRPQEAVTAKYVSTGNHALYQACPFFSLAALQLKQLGLACDPSSDSPVGEQRTVVGADEVDFVDPPSITYGVGNPSGGRNRAIGIELFDVRYGKGGSAIQNAATATCTLAPTRRHYCSAVFRDVRSHFHASLK